MQWELYTQEGGHVKIGDLVTETSNREIKHHTRKVGELRFIRPAGPEDLTL